MINNLTIHNLNNKKMETLQEIENLINEIKAEKEGKISDLKNSISDLIQKLNSMNQYELAAQAIADHLNIKMRSKFLKNGFYFPGDKDARSIFQVTLIREKKSYRFTFGQSIAAGSKRPTMYDVLARLQKYDIGSYDDFCNEFGYEHGTAKKIYSSVCKEFENMCILFTDEELEILSEIN